MSKTAGEAGWRVSRYNLAARIPDSGKIAVANLFRGTCGVYSPIEMYLLDELENLDENHPMLQRFRERGMIVNYDERAALETKARVACAAGGSVGLTICPTMGCNFDCPYCFENHRPGRMSREVQDDVVALAERMMKASGAKKLTVHWFGGEPLLAPDIIETLSGRLVALAEEQDAEYDASIITNGYLLTQEIADMLGRCKVSYAQITLDGVGPEHDKTRHLAGGGPTYDRIVDNLRSLRLPFRVNVRHIVSEGNKNQIMHLWDTLKTLAEESGNRISYYASPVHGTSVAEERGIQVDTLCSADQDQLDLVNEAGRFGSNHGTYSCGAQHLFSAGIDERGRLFKCWEDADKTARSFASAKSWDPADPIATADHPDHLTNYLNTALPTDDTECRNCVLLPQCLGGCPTRRLYYQKACFEFRNAPEKLVLALYKRLQKEIKKTDHKEDKP